MMRTYSAIVGQCALLPWRRWDSFQHLNITSISHVGKAEEKIYAFLLSSLDGVQWSVI
jgi:hypothetical protein